MSTDLYKTSKMTDIALSMNALEHQLNIYTNLVKEHTKMVEKQVEQTNNISDEVTRIRLSSLSNPFFRRTLIKEVANRINNDSDQARPSRFRIQNIYIKNN